MTTIGERCTLILSRTWDDGSECAFVTRALAGAASRSSATVVAIPGAVGPSRPDGAFDVHLMGQAPDGGWPHPDHAVWPERHAGDTAVIVDRPDGAALALVERLAEDHGAAGRPIWMVPGAASAGTGATALPLTRAPGGAGPGIGLHVPVNPLATVHRHNGLGFTGYLLVLSDRTQAGGPTPPPDLVAWLTARYPARQVVVVEDATAAVWQGRALRGVIDVHTRTDLWRLIVHAAVTVDLGPGPVIGRECVESLLFGTPIVVPTHSAAAPHVEAGGGLSFSSSAQMLASVETLLDHGARRETAQRGRDHAEDLYGDPQAFVARLSATLWGP